MLSLLDAARDAGLTKLIARVFFPENAPSRALLASLGFREIGIHERHARLDGVRRYILVAERILESNPAAGP